MDKTSINTEKWRELSELLETEGCSCVVRNGNETRIFRERGVKDLLRLLREHPECLRGAVIADKVVGKAAAALMILGGVEEVFARVISRPARTLFLTTGIRVNYIEQVPHIINRAQTGWCPLETRCFTLQTPEECLVRIEEFTQETGNIRRAT